MVQELGNNIMTKNNLLRLVFLLLLPFIITACSDKDNETETKAETVKIINQQNKIESNTANQVETIKKTDEIPIEKLMQQVAEAEREANKFGFVWSTTDDIIKKAYAEAKLGNENEAKILFHEAVMQFNLSIEQAKYATQNWKQLVPE